MVTKSHQMGSPLLTVLVPIGTDLWFSQIYCSHSWAHFTLYLKEAFSFYFELVFQLFAFLGKKISTQFWDSLAPIFSDLARFFIFSCIL